jgi:hypothetical protein
MWKRSRQPPRELLSDGFFQPCDRILVVGGNCSKVGKTSLLVDILRTFPVPGQVAVKISTHSHGDCPVNGPRCSCGPEEHTFSFLNEAGPPTEGDTARFLAAGAQCAILLRTKQGRLAEALPPLFQMVTGADRLFFESNTIAPFLRHAFYLAVLDPRKIDFKASLAATLPLVDAFVLASPLTAARWPAAYLEVIEERARFLRPHRSPLPVVLKHRIRGHFGQT